MRFRVFQKLWIRLLEIYDYVRGIEWKWQSLDSVSVKNSLEDLIGPNPTDTGKEKQNISLDKGYDSLEIEQEVVKRRGICIACLS
jgi:hypothetical protein